MDFGCKTQLTFDNDIKVSFQVPISKRLKRLDRKISKNNRKNSKNKYKDQIKRQKEYLYLINKKNDIKNKIVNAIISNYQYVCFQDENIHAWHSGNNGKKIQNSGIGGIISDLKHKSHTPIMIHKFFPSTQLCPKCNNKNKPSLSDRIYKCDCGYINDRDIKSAICIKNEAMKSVPTEHRELTLGEIMPTVFYDTLNKIDGIIVSKVNR